MDTNKIFGIVAILAIALAGIATAAMAIPINIVDTKIDGTSLAPDATTRLNLERNNQLDVKVDLMATADDTNVEVDAFISGYEYDSTASLSKSSEIFDVNANTEYIKTLSFQLPSDVQKDDYKLRILITDRNGQELIQDYNLKVDSARHVMNIVGVVLSDSNVKSGSALLSTVRVENRGQNTESNVKVTVSVPDLGLSATGYIDDLKADKQKDSEELYLRIPTCAKAGVYQLDTEVDYNSNHNSVKSTTPFQVVESDSCTPAPVPVKQPTTTVVIQQPVVQQPEPAKDSSSTVKTALEVILLVLIGLVVVIGIVLGLSRMGKDDETEQV
jgi:hypothetical protein